MSTGNLASTISILRYPDGFRAQFFLQDIKLEVDRMLEHENVSFFVRDHKILHTLLEDLIDEIDRSIAPCFAYEIAAAKNHGHLIGDTPNSRYESFFIKNGAWSKSMHGIKNKYGSLFENMRINLRFSANNLIECIERFLEDEHEVRSTILGGDQSPVIAIKLLSADRHRDGRQPLLIEFASGGKIVYKPTNLVADELFGRFIELLELPEPFNLRYAKVLAKNLYGWIEFIEHRPCASKQEVVDFYRRSGTLLAIADFLNYTDGHGENLIASGSFPVLIDGETLFQPGMHDLWPTDKRSVFFTLLVQAVPEDVEKLNRLSAAFQTPADCRVHVVQPHILNDLTDEIRIQFKGIRAPDTQQSRAFWRTTACSPVCRTIH